MAHLSEASSLETRSACTKNLCSQLENMDHASENHLRLAFAIRRVLQNVMLPTEGEIGEDISDSVFSSESEASCQDSQFDSQTVFRLAAISRRKEIEGYQANMAQNKRPSFSGGSGEPLDYLANRREQFAARRDTQTTVITITSAADPPSDVELPTITKQNIMALAVGRHTEDSSSASRPRSRARSGSWSLPNPRSILRSDADSSAVSAISSQKRVTFTCEPQPSEHLPDFPGIAPDAPIPKPQKVNSAVTLSRRMASLPDLPSILDLVSL